MKHDGFHDITNAVIDQRQRAEFGVLLSEMTETNWAPFREEAKRFNAACPDDDYGAAEELEDMTDRFFELHNHVYRGVCARCGWWVDCISSFHGASVERTAAASLRQFDLQSPDLGLPEIKAHLARRFADIYLVSPRTFEQVVASVYRELGWEVALTKQTRDGGVDLFCLRKTTGEICIVECKRYARSRKVGINYVDRLLGVAFRNRAQHAHLITSSAFTGPATEASKQAQCRALALKLVDAHELAQLLQLYSDPDITVKDLGAIFATPPLIDP